MPRRTGETRILIVEDEEVVADTLGQILSAHGYEVRVVYSAEAAMATVSTWIPNLCILDVMLPKMNGIDFAVLLNGDLPDCRVILFSGQPNVEQLLQKASAEGHHFEILAKPIHPTTMLNVISNLLCPGGPAPCTLT
jgi:DNA-binding NtrC family response regulator